MSIPLQIYPRRESPTNGTIMKLFMAMGGNVNGTVQQMDGENESV